MNRINVRWMAGIAAASFALVSAGCGNKLLGISSSIVVSPDNVAFGSGTVGVAQAKTITVTNAGSAPLTVSAIKVASDPNHELSVANVLTNNCAGNGRSGSNTLAAGECASFSVVWSPAGAHAADGSIEVDSSDGSAPVITLPVTGNAASPDLEYCVLDSSGNETGCSDFSMSQATPTVDFGSARPNVATTRTVRLKNNGAAPLTFVSQPAIDATQSTLFSLSSGAVANNTLAPLSHQDFVISATPTANGSVNGGLLVNSMDLRVPMLNIPLRIFVAGGAVCVAPPTGLNFGSVTLGQTQPLQITFTNCGTADLVVNSFFFNGYSPTTNQFTITGGALPTSGATFAAGASVTLTVTYAPVAVRADKASFDYTYTYAADSSRAITGSVNVVGSGAAAACGTSGATSPVANIVTYYGNSAAGATTQFDPTAMPSKVVPLDYVKFSGTTSVATGTPTYSWQLTSQPAGSHATLLTPASASSTMQTLVSGDYTVQLTVKDASSCIGTASVTIHVVPSGDVHIELTWPESCGDVDLHYVKSGATQCQAGDCFYGNKSTNWGSKLDVDDQWGYGPENITQANPADGNSYGIWVYYYSSSPDGGGGPASGSCGTTHPEVKVYFKGVLANTFTLTAGFGNQQLWHAANVAVSNSASMLVATAADTTAKFLGCE
jgi:hypothetical protein